MQCKKRSGMVDVYLLHVRKQPRFENVCVSQIYLQAALPGGMVNPLDKIGEPEDINIDVSQSRVTVRNADQQLSIALLGCCHLFICFLSYIFIPYFNSLVFVWWTNFYTIPCFACKVPLSYNVFLPDPGVLGVWSIGLGLSNWLTNDNTFWNFADVTLADEDTKSKLVRQMTIRVAPPGVTRWDVGGGGCGDWGSCWVGDGVGVRQWGGGGEQGDGWVDGRGGVGGVEGSCGGGIAKGVKRNDGPWLFACGDV